MLARAVEVIDAHGETAIRIRDIAGHCGVTAPIVYKAFGSREGLIVKAHTERYLRSWRDSSFVQIEAIKNSTTVEELKAVVLAAQTEAFTPERAYHRRVRTEVLGASMSNPALAEAVRQAVRQVHAVFVDALDTVRARGLIRNDFDIPAAVMWYLGQVDGRVLLETSGDDIDGARWNDVVRKASFFLLFGDK